MHSFSRGRNRYPVFFEGNLERGDEWIACEREDESERPSYLQSMGAVPQRPFVQNLALKR